MKKTEKTPRFAVVIFALCLSCFSCVYSQAARAQAPSTDPEQFRQFLKLVIQEYPTGFVKLRGRSVTDALGVNWEGTATPTRNSPWTCKTYINPYAQDSDYTCRNQDIGPDQARGMEVEGKMLAQVVKDTLGQDWSFLEHPELYDDNRPSSVLKASNPAAGFNVKFLWEVANDRRSGSVEIGFSGKTSFERAKRAQIASAPAAALTQTPRAAAATQRVFMAGTTPEERAAYREAFRRNSLPAEAFAAAAAQFAVQYPRSVLRGMLYRRAMVHYGSEGNHAEVIEMGKKAVAADPTNPVVLLDVAVLWVESARTTDADYEQRLTDAARFAQSSISDLDSGLAVTGSDYPETIAATKARILGDAYDVLGQVDMSRKRFISGEVLFKKAVDARQAEPSEKVYLHLAQVQESLKKYALALDSVNKAISLDQGDYTGKNLIEAAHQLRRRLVPLVPGAATAGAGCPALQPGTQNQGQKMIKDPNEYNSYISVLNQQDPKQKTLAFENFIADYPCTIMMEEAEVQLMSQYQQAGDDTKTVEKARRVLQINGNNVIALLMLAYYYEGQAAGGKGDVQGNVNQSRQYAERGLAALPNETRGDGMTDADFAKVQKERGAILEEAVGFAALNQKDYRTAQTYMRKALAHQATPDISTLYRLSLADLEATPQNLEGFWIIAKAIQMAQGAAKQQFVDYGRRKYIHYHGSEEGWDQVVNTAKSSQSLMPPEGFTAAVTAMASPAERAVKAVKENDPSTLSLTDWEFILSYRDASPANREASDKVWAVIRDLEKHGATKIKLHVKVISSTKDELYAAITDDNQAAKKADLKVKMEVAMLHPPAPGTMIDIIGVLTDYTSQPFMFSMSGGELPAGKE